MGSSIKSYQVTLPVKLITMLCTGRMKTTITSIILILKENPYKMKSKKMIIIYLQALTLLFDLSCKDKAVGPEEIKPGRRDYTWTVDTIQIFSNNILSIWGSSPDDIWGVGPGGDLATTIWHYDGNNWSTDGIGRNLSPECVYGFARNDVWIAGMDGKIWHYDGNNWTQNYQHTINGFTGVSFYDLYGTSNRDLYAVGTVWFDNETRRGIILHYNGITWKQEYLADINSYFYKVRESSDKRCFIHCIKQDVQYNSNDTTVFYEFDEKVLKEIYSDENKSIKGGWMTIIKGDIVFSFNDGIYKYIDSTFLPITKYESQRTPGAVFGRNDKDILIGTTDGISHFNGTDIHSLVTTAGWINDGQIFEKDIVFLDIELASLIYHGKLK
jgi:hypothetical protein